MWKGKINKSKTNFTPSPFHILNCWITTKFMTLKFSDYFQFVFINVFWKIKRDCMSVSFCIANLLEVGRKIITILRILTTSKRKWILYLIPKSVLSPEKNMMGIISLPPPLSKYEVKIHCWEYDYLNLLSLLIQWIKNHFLNIGFHKLFHTYFYCLNLCWTNVFLICLV